MNVNLAIEGRSDKMRSVYLNGFNEVMMFLFILHLPKSLYTQALELEGNSANFAGFIPVS